MPSITFAVSVKAQINGAGAAASVNLQFREVAASVTTPLRGASLALNYIGTDADFAAASAIALNAAGSFVW